MNEAEAHDSSILSIQTHPSEPGTVLTQGRDGWIHAWDMAGSGLTKKGEEEFISGCLPRFILNLFFHFKALKSLNFGHFFDLRS